MPKTDKIHLYADTADVKLMYYVGEFLADLPKSDRLTVTTYDTPFGKFRFDKCKYKSGMIKVVAERVRENINAD